ncbi:alpha/beta hydrolase [Mesobacillus foraminis]|uniref:alpha/beta hydrolase n=1 Tax=Mesobacillus foraminis TaxID=279826 RepID=UPI001BEB7662|nr:alpha/beta hydrolase [Mesobacillus foraminis]MBT2756912.1 alpha/beta hydrolase [Mesobacillus foraminis]
MLIEKINLWDDDEDVALHTYILTNSKEYQKDQKRPAVLICPGGGYLGTSDREAEPVAMRFAAQGYHTFVLRYTTYFNTMNLDFQNLPSPNEKSAYPQPLADLAKAMLIVRENAANWLVDTERIAVCGFSAGGHLAASLGVHWHSGLLREKLKAENEWFKPNAVILGYPLLDYQLMKEKVEEDPNEFAKGFWEISNKALLGTPHPSEDQLQEVSPGNHISDKTPATFIWHTADDSLVYAENALNYAAALARNKVPYELHVFESGVHGLSLSDEVTAGNGSHINEECQVWFELASKWLKKRFK